ncbi:MAG: YraN family protein [Mameliella sp.]|nr:YraN family protein [Phaeodactylibacter sp.]NRA48791.1 YraN family protein [Phaeodactylibacter sp.]
MARHNEIGKAGEQIAKNYLTERGYRILEENWRYRRAEVDLIAMDKDTLVIVEVKTRNTTAFGEIEDFVTRKKEDLLAAAAHAYMDHIDHDWAVRFDIIAILYLDEKSYSVKHIEDAFFPGLG